jgi:hypothetical protein
MNFIVVSLVGFRPVLSDTILGIYPDLAFKILACLGSAGAHLSAKIMGNVWRAFDLDLIMDIGNPTPLVLEHLVKFYITKACPYLGNMGTRRLEKGVECSMC